MKVLVIPEDFRLDQYLLAPIVRRMLIEVGRSTAKVEVCRDPLLRGVYEALKWDRIRPLIDMYPMVDLFLLVVDRDGEPGRRQALDRLERSANDHLRGRRTFFAENAWQELEVWGLAGQSELPGNPRWADVRAERDAKERYFDPWATQRGVADGPGEGRKTLGEEAARNYPRVRQLCPEDVAALEVRIRAWLAS
jgi:hypothetical protein